MMNKKWLAICIILFAENHSCFSQKITVSASKNKILIGEQFVYNVSVTVPKTTQVDFFAIPDSLEGFEIITRNKIDTTLDFENATYRQQVIFTSFDSGHFVIPSFYLSEDIVTDTIGIDIGYANDSLNVIRDIKPISEPPQKKLKWWYFVIGGLLLLVLVTAIIVSLMKGRKKQPAVIQPKISPYAEAMNSLKHLQLSSIPAEIKMYHSALTDIFKQYYTRKTGVNIHSFTTGNILLQLASQKTDTDAIAETASALRCNDAVKFAKFIPGEQQSISCFNQVKTIIQSLENNNNR